jgi:hypothetical protein
MVRAIDAGDAYDNRRGVVRIGVHRFGLRASVVRVNEVSHVTAGILVGIPIAMVDLVAQIPPPFVGRAPVVAGEVVNRFVRVVFDVDAAIRALRVVEFTSWGVQIHCVIIVKAVRWAMVFEHNRRTVDDDIVRIIDS